jgi:hypothetical protein
MAWPFRNRVCGSKGMLIAMRQLISEYVGHDLDDASPEKESRDKHHNRNKETDLKGHGSRENAAEESKDGGQDRHQNVELPVKGHITYRGKYFSMRVP